MRKARGRWSAAALAAALLLAIPAAFSTNAGAVGEISQAKGDFLSGSALTVDLATLVALQGASAQNVGSPALVEQAHPLDVTALSAINVDLGGGVNLLGSGGLLTLGAANQYAHANNDGSSYGASGAVTNSGLVSVGGGGPQGQANLNLTPVLATAGASTALSNAQLSAGAVAATANQTAAGTQTGTYEIANLNLDLTSPLIAGIKASLAPVIGAAQSGLDNLVTNSIITALCPPIGVCQLLVDAPLLQASVDALTTINLAGGAVVVDLNTGAIHVDIAALLAFHGLNLNSLAPNINLLSLVQSLLSGDLLTGLQATLNTLITTLTSEINSTGVAIAGVPIAPVVLAAALAPITAAMTAGIQAIITALGPTVVQPVIDALSLLLAITVNNQDVAAGAFTETTLRVQLVPALSLATVNLAAASAGPNAGPATPTSTGLTPASGPATGGQTVTVDGTGFVPGATSVNIGGNTVPEAAVTVAPDGNSLTFSTPAHAAGAVAVTVTTAGGTSTPALTYTYLAAPTTTGLTPPSGPIAGGTGVIIDGAGFVPGQTSVTIAGITVLAAGVTVLPGNASLTFVTPAHAAGPVPVTVTTPGGTSAPALTFSYLDAPTATDLSPTSGPVAGGQTVTVNGANFVPGQTSVIIGGVVVPAGSVTVAPAGASLTFATPAHAVGPVQVTVTTPGGTTGPLDYSYLDVPGAASLDPTQGPVAGGQTVTMTGTNFVPASTTVTIGGVVVPAASVTVASGTSLSFPTPAHAVGPVQVTVTTPGGVTGPLDYTYVLVPTVTGLSPAAGPASGGQTVTITGTGFVPGQTMVTIGGNTVPAGQVTVSPAGTSLDFVTPARSPGTVGVTVTTPGGTAAAPSYEYLPLPAPPVIQAPTGGSTVTTAQPVISGTGAPGATVTAFEAGTPLCTATVQPDGSWSCTPSAPLGKGVHTVTARQTTTGGISADATPVTFTVAVPPTIESMVPPQGPTSGSTKVTITGTGFVPGQTTVTIGGITVPAASVTVAPDGHSLAFSTPAHPNGPVTVTVTTTAGTSAPRTFTYIPPAVIAPPAITAPADGSLTGPDPTISGTGTPGGVVTVTDGDGTMLCTATVDASGNWRCTATDLAPGSHRATAIQRTAVGTSAPSGPVTFTVTGLAATGTELVLPAMAGLVALLSGLVLVLAAALPRRRRMPAPARPRRSDPTR
jgi:hypothetical protein